MQISTTSIISLLIWGNITIIILCVLCSVPKIFNKMNFRFMISLLTIVFIRFLYPFEITSITQAIPLKGHFFKIVNFIRETDLNFFERTIYIYQILLFLWFSMALFLLLKIVFKYIVYKRNLKDVILERNKPVEPDMLAFNIPQNLIIYVSDAIVTPAITGIIHPIILLPDLTLSQQELKLIFQHELQHYKFKDTLLKICIEIFCVIYWWNPFMYVLKKQLLFLLEIRADSYVYEHLDNTDKICYLECLALICKYQSNSFELGLGFNGIQSNYSLLKRAEYLVNDNRNVKTSQLISIFIILILTCSFLLIFEPFTIPHHVKEKSFDLSNDSYILQTEEGTFELYMNNERVAVIDNPDTDGMDELPIYEFEKEGKVIRE